MSKQTIRRSFLIASAAVSLVLCAATIALWVRSHRIADACSYVTADAAVYSVCSTRGGVLLMYTSVSAAELSVPRPYWRQDSAAVVGLDEPVRRTWGGQGWNGSYYGNTSVLRVPSWFVVALFASLPALLIARRLRGAVAPGLCRACAYDLRATPGRCPECGAVPREPPHEQPLERTAAAV